MSNPPAAGAFAPATASRAVEGRTSGEAVGEREKGEVRSKGAVSGEGAASAEGAAASGP